MEITATGRGLSVRAPAKINLWLEVGPRRPDGFHEIDSLFQTVGLFDELELERRDDGRIELVEEGVEEGEENLVHRAARALAGEAAKSGQPCRGARIRLRKRIPAGAGLGGGSSDAAATLVGLTRLWGLSIGAERLVELGAELGSDVPFFFWGGTARCRGRGELVTPYHQAFDAARFTYVLVCPSVPTSTARVYAALAAMRSADARIALTPASPLDSIAPPDCVGRLARGELMFNRLEVVTFQLFPELEKLSARMSEERFIGVRMTGSGSALFGLSPSSRHAARAACRLEQSLHKRAHVHVVESLPGSRVLPGS